MRTKKLLLLTVFLLSLTVYLQAFISFGFFGGTSAQKPTRQGLEFNTDTRFVYGIRAGVRLLVIGLEAQYFQAAHHLQLTNLPHSWHDRQLDFSYLGVAVKTYFSLLLLHPYLSVGYGYYSAEMKGVDKDRQAGFSGGLGLELSLGHRFSLQAEGKYHRVSLRIDKGDFKLGDLVLTAGFNINF